MFCSCPTAKEEEKQKLMKWSAELKLDREQLEQRVKQLSNSITVRYLFIFSLTGAFLDTRLTVQLFCVTVKGCLPQKTNFKRNIQLFHVLSLKYSVQLVTWHTIVLLRF